MSGMLKHAWPRIVRNCLLAATLALILIPPVTVLAEGPNLLRNPGFEPPFAASIPGKENCLIAVPWVAWFIQGSEYDMSLGQRLAPEYKLATRADYPGNRVRNGELAQQYFHSFGSFEAGVLQVVPNVTPGARYRFEMWAMTWSCDKESKGNCEGCTSGDPSPMHLRIGIDPTGGTDVFSPAIVWSPEQNAYDSWHQLQVEAAAQNSTITVFVYSHPDYPSQDNNVYLDDASLVLIGPPPSPTPRPTNTPTNTPLPTNTPVATNTPPPTATTVPTNTPAATDTPPATATLLPTDTPMPTNTPQPTATPTATPVPLLDQLTSGPLILVPLIGLALVIWLSVGAIVARRRG